MFKFITLLLISSSIVFSAQELQSPTQNLEHQFRGSVMIENQPIPIEDKKFFDLYYKALDFNNEKKYVEAENILRTLNPEKAYIKEELAKALLYQNQQKKVEEGMKLLVESYKQGNDDAGVLLRDISTKDFIILYAKPTNEIEKQAIQSLIQSWQNNRLE